MNSGKDFYSSGLGDNLVDESMYPDEIIHYLSAEQNVVTSLVDQFDTLVEVGCMNGRYIDWAVKEGKKYLGVDVVERYVKDGQRRVSQLSRGCFRIEVCDATLIHSIPSAKGWISEEDKILLLFPFNSFGNMSEPVLVADSLFKCQYPFVICSYSTGEYSNKIRTKYYENCGYKKIRCISDNRGVRFLSDDGLDTIAYDPAYLKQTFRERGIAIKMIPFSRMGIAYLGNF